MNLDRWMSFIYTPTAFYGKFHCLRSDFEWLVSINRWVLLFFKTYLTVYVLRKSQFITFTTSDRILTFSTVMKIAGVYKDCRK